MPFACCFHQWLSCPVGFRPPFHPPLCRPCDTPVLRLSSWTLPSCAVSRRTTALAFAGLPVKTHPTKQQEMLLAKAGVTLAYCIVLLPGYKTKEITLLVREGLQLFLLTSFVDCTATFTSLR
jgi:hypothetical protein